MLRHAAVHNGPRIVRGRWSHLTADTGAELRDFAGRLRLNPELIQKPGTVLEHYDFTAAVREHALRLGAVPIAYGEGGYLTLCNGPVSRSTSTCYAEIDGASRLS